MKYIPAEKLIAEIERRLKIVEPHKDTFESAAACRQELIWMKDFIASLQQEQPNKYETALEKAREWMPNVNQGGHSILIDIFPELGEGLDPRYGGRKQERQEVDLEKEVEFECIGKKVKMTVQGLIDYYIDTECSETAIECGF